MKHKHYDLIVAWANGAEIQARETSYFADDDVWMTTKTPTWCQTIEYRIKPKTIKYRTYLWKDHLGHCGVYSCTEKQNIDNDYEYSAEFIKWLSDWQEVEV